MRTRNGFPQRERELHQKRKNENRKWVPTERERASSEKKKMRTRNGFPERERESFIRKEKMRTKNGFSERERERTLSEKRELYQKRKNENARIIKGLVEEIIKKN